jgi:hypothetical protein
MAPVWWAEGPDYREAGLLGKATPGGRARKVEIFSINEWPSTPGVYSLNSVASLYVILPQDIELPALLPGEVPQLLAELSIHPGTPISGLMRLIIGRERISPPEAGWERGGRARGIPFGSSVATWTTSL